MALTVIFTFTLICILLITLVLRLYRMVQLAKEQELIIARLEREDAVLWEKYQAFMAEQLQTIQRSLL